MMRRRTNDSPRRFYEVGSIAAIVFGLTIFVFAAPKSITPSLRFEISLPPSVRNQPITGRAFVIITRNKDSEPRLQAGVERYSVPFFGVDVENLKPGEPAVIDGDTLGYPPRSLKDIPAGDYYVQALLNVYTEFHRSDGHVVWAHMDQWEGQQFNRSPGNPISEVQKIRLDPQVGYAVKLDLTKVIPPVDVPPDTKWVKRVKFESKLLTRFWGHPIYLGATILLPKDYDTHPNVQYPVVYLQEHFPLVPRAPFGFTTQNSPETEEARISRLHRGQETGYEFYQAWSAENFPRIIAVAIQHPTPYFDDSYAVNSANNGPYGDAILTELIPYLEKNFRMIRKSYARVLTGGSTGGWISLALQIYHPDFYGGTWTFYPDPIDFRRYGPINIYEDESAFSVSGNDWTTPERYFYRTPDGQPRITMRQLSQLEEVRGTKGRSGWQLDIWQATYGPVGGDGYPKPLWDKLTGKIDHQVAEYMRNNGYDLRHYLESNWPKIGPKLVGKLFIYCGDMDDYYLNLAVYHLEEFLKNTKNPHYAGSFEYGRPMKGHGWHPMNNAQLIRQMANHITRNAEPNANSTLWKYK